MPKIYVPTPEAELYLRRLQEAAEPKARAREVRQWSDFDITYVNGPYIGMIRHPARPRPGLRGGRRRATMNFG